MKRIIYVLTLTSVVLLCNMWTANSQSVTIDMGTEHQIIRGFGGMNHPEWRPDMTEDVVHMCYGNEPSQLGMSIFRTHVPSDSSRFGVVVPSALLAQQEHGALVFASPWNPPAYMLDTASSGNWYVDPDYYGAYTHHLNAFIDTVESHGISMYAISVQNEPDIAEWTTWNAAQFINYLTAYGDSINTLVMAPESFQFRSQLMDPILNDSVAASKIDIVVGHIYGGGLKEQTLAMEKGKEVWMTEHLLGSNENEVNDWNLAMVVAKEISDCMEASFSAYLWWYTQRFYSLVTEGGDITDKGFVMSQFSKYIRPGAIRLGATVESATNVSATAYATDTSLVIVVVNEGNNAVTLDYIVQNGNVDTLVQFTTSATKKMVNDGGVSVGAGTFSATVDARSITTFTSYAANGPAFGNSSPVVNLGNDLELLDEEGDGEIVTFDGSAASDSDGEIIRYNWVLNDRSVSKDSTLELSVTIGQHELILTVTDDQGAIAADTITIVVNTLYETEIWLDVECAQVGSSWQILEDENASNGKYIEVIPGIESLSEPSADTADQLILDFHIPEAGPYKVWGRVIAPSANDDSFWVTMDDDAVSAMWNNIPTGTEWHWDDVHTNSNNDDVMVYQLDTGYHSLTIVFREDGASLDKIYITNTGKTPDGIGPVDPACPEKQDPDTIDNIENKSGLTELYVFPNPANDHIQVNWQEGFNSIALLGVDGKIYHHQELSGVQKSMDLQLRLQPGMYYLMVRNQLYMRVVKVLIQ